MLFSWNDRPGFVAGPLWEASAIRGLGLDGRLVVPSRCEPALVIRRLPCGERPWRPRVSGRVWAIVAGMDRVGNAAKRDRLGRIAIVESVPARYDRERLIELLQRDALKRGTFTLASGRTSHYYVDGRKLTLSAEGAALIGAGVLELLARSSRSTPSAG